MKSNYRESIEIQVKHKVNNNKRQQNKVASKACTYMGMASPRTKIYQTAPIRKLQKLKKKTDIKVSNTFGNGTEFNQFMQVASLMLPSNILLEQNCLQFHW